MPNEEIQQVNALSSQMEPPSIKKQYFKSKEEQNKKSNIGLSQKVLFRGIKRDLEENNQQEMSASSSNKQHLSRI